MIPPIHTMQGAFDLTGKTCLITGGNRGLGQGCALAMAQQGANVVIICRDETTAEETVNMLQQYGGRYGWIPCDISDHPSVRLAVALVSQRFGEIDILINNAGVSCLTDLLDMDEDLSDWYRVINTDLNGTVHMTYEVAKRMRDAGRGGSIINITSMSGQIVNKAQHMSPYNTAKAALNHFTRCMAVELGQYNIRVNAIAPGYTNSELSHFIPDDAYADIIHQMPLRRFGEPMEIGAAAVYLASPAAAQITGHIHLVDGGYTLAV
ncbi:MAG: SDR family oxidoreductase [Oscillospiraceae bacterium]|nr:SDR family oxidoreductase [Oscillospiraceae bacterium]